MYIAHILENFQFNAACTCIITKIYDKRISSVIDLLRLWNLLVCTTLNVSSPIMNVLLLLAQVMHEVVVVEGKEDEKNKYREREREREREVWLNNKRPMLMMEFLFCYLKALCSFSSTTLRPLCGNMLLRVQQASQAGYAEVISMIASTCRGRIACAVMNLSRETKTNST
ncbi:hypothetical protein T05_3239 [Trichinella murrelli]|uniref:Uncharacterized protein n=1 Tax=Trichinella murrelli TaxID=144512 RepID=A0A0V0U6U1_9BILA|nr:hypothetical protein T05_3239 [Trichinella murrelli]